MDYFKEIIKTDPVNHYFVLTSDRLIKLKKHIKNNEINLLVEKLSYLKHKPYFTVVDKDIKDCYGVNRHNYISLATYYWPNSETTSGLPYIQKDGYANPEGDKYDKDRLRETSFISYYELLLYYLTENREYYYDVKRRLTMFFLKKDTKMFPNMNHAQMIRGINSGRGIGIIDFSANMTYTLILLKSLYELNLIEKDFYADILGWLRKFLDWLRYSDIALQERDASNNHGTMYDFLLLVLYDIFKNNKEIKSLVYFFINERLIKQIALDGSLPKELARTKSKSYSLMGIKGMYDIAAIVKSYGYDLYNLDWYYKEVKVNIKDGIKYIVDNLIVKDNWQGKQVTYFDYATLLPTLYEAYSLDLVKDTNIVEKYEYIDDLLKIIFTNLL